jgi:two-component system sensor histidine kinase TorS
MAIMVGLTAIAVNWYLIRSHGRLIQQNLPIVELASNVGTEAGLTAQFATAFVQADSSQTLQDLTVSLTQSLERIEAGVNQLELLSRNPDQTSSTADIRLIVTRMSRNARQVLRLKNHMARQLAVQKDTSLRFDLLLEAELDLARLRVTSGVSDIYSAPPSDVNKGLDLLADRHFFAFDRLTELTRVADTVQGALQQIVDIQSVPLLGEERRRIERLYKLVSRRIEYLPTLSGQDEARALLAGQRKALDPGGLFSLRRQELEAQLQIESDSFVLRERITALATSAQETRQAAMTRVLSQIAANNRLSIQLSVGLLLFVIFCTIIGALAWRRLRRSIIARLHAVSERIVRVAGGDYAQKVPLTGHDEIGRMEKALNILRRRAADSEKLRANLADAVLERTGDVVREMHAANAARAEAESANRSKTEFLARMSHEIRTPLNGVIGLLGLLEADETDADRRARIAMTLGSAQDLLAITNDILTFSSSDDPRAAVAPVHFETRTMTGQMAEYLQAMAAPAGLATDVDFRAQIPPVLVGDAVKIRQVVTNLLSNAVKYTPQGSVSLSVDFATDAATGTSALSFVVSDTGVGMTVPELDHAFDVYARTDQMRHSGVEGVGLGLPIARQLTEAMGGALNAESQPGVGSRFTLTVPVQLGDPAQLPTADDRGQGPEFRQSVRVIDDHAVNRIVSRGYLERLGCSVAEAADGKGAVAAAQATRFDLILIDLDLPDMPGADLAVRLRRISPDTTLAALTAFSVADTAQDRAKLGVDRILSKPISPRALVDLLSGGTAAAPPDASPAVNGAASDVTLRILQDDIADLGAETAQNIVQTLIDEIPGAVQQIITAAPTDHRKLAHRLKGAVMNFQLTELRDELIRFETPDGPVSDGMFQALQEAATRAIATLHDAARKAGLQTDPGSTNR